MNAIPTTYRGIRMRSRLEAEWAFVFDKMGWKWHYEAVDHKGWIPDFLIESAPEIINLHIHRLRPPAKPFLVEVKPAMGAFAHRLAPENMTLKIERALQAPATRVRGVSGTQAEWDAFYAGLDYHFLLLGVHPDHAWWMQESFGWWTVGADERWPNGPYADPVTTYCGFIPGDYEALWAQAINATQWKASK